MAVSNSQWIPPEGKGALYLRPLLFGSGANLGVGPSSAYTFVIFASPVGNYFKGDLVPIDLMVSSSHRAAPFGSGGVKYVGNYASVFRAQKEAKTLGFNEALFLDAKNDKYVEEAGAANFFCITKDNVVHTPKLGTILPGVTRDSVVQICKSKGWEVKEDSFSIDTLMNDTKEVFCSGTGACISPVGSVTYKGQKTTFQDRTMTKEIYETLIGIQYERIQDPFNWIFDPVEFLTKNQ